MNSPQTMEEAPQVSERRNFKRIRFDRPVRFQFKDPSFFGGCLSQDISAGGVRVNFNDFVPLWTVLTLQIQLAGERVVECKGRVVWVTKLPFMDRYQLGMEFERGDSFGEARKAILQVISS